jgi:hypothetical protein
MAIFKVFYTNPLFRKKVLLRVDTKRKEGGKFKGLAYWRAPPKDKECWKRIIGMMEPDWLISK